MAQDPSTANLLSSKSNNTDFVGTFKSMGSTSLVDGPLGKGLTFDGSTEYIDVPWAYRLGNQSITITTEACYTGQGPLIATNRDAVGMGDAKFTIGSDNIGYNVYALSGAPYNAYFLLYPTGFNNLEFNYAGFSVADNVINICSNSETNSQIFDWSWGSTPYSYTDITLFKHKNYAYGTDLFKGTCYEFRISSTGRSSAWMKATNYTAKDDLISFPVLTKKVTGIVTENTVPVIRHLRLYHSSDGSLVSETDSDTSGYYELSTPYSDSHYVVCMDDVSNSYNYLISKDVPLENI
jgi:hypothetical protein